MSNEPVPLSYSANALLGILEDRVQGEASAAHWLEALASHDRGLVASAVPDGDVDAVVSVAAGEGHGSGRMVTAAVVADRASDHAAAQGGAVAKTSDVAAALVDMVREDRASGENATEAPPVVPEKGAAQPEEVREARAGATAERVVRVFVSSTFRDMGAERDELVKRVFPQIRKLCDERGVAWGEVDLRWGITDEQVAEGKVLPICLAEIDRSRPYFIGLLGERYGSMPDKIDAELIEREPWLGEHLGHSVTEVEIQHGVLRNPAMAEHAYFYLRDPAYVETLPEGERGGYREASAEFAAKRDALKERIRRSGFPVREAYADPRTLGQLVLEDFTALIERLFPEGSLPDPLDREAAEHEPDPAERERAQVEAAALDGRGDVARTEGHATYDSAERREALASDLERVGVDREIVATRVRADVSQAVPATEATRTAMKKSPKARKGRAGRGQRVQRTGLDR